MSARAASNNTNSGSVSFTNLFPNDELLKIQAISANSAGPSACREALQLAFSRATGDSLSSSTNSSNGAIVSFFERILRRLVISGSDDADKTSSLSALGLDAAIISDIISVIKRGKGALLEAFSKDNPRFSQYLTNMRWRIDVTISSSSLNRVMRPSILMELTLNDGSVELFDVPLEEFHKLRYSCAKALSAMGAIESHPVLRIQ
jgi:hypothetical protein